MNTLTKRIITASCAAAVAAAAFAADGGASADSQSKFYGQKFDALSLEQSEKASAWVAVPFTKDIVFDVRGYYRYSYTAQLSDMQSGVNNHRLDLTRAALAWRIPLDTTKNVNITAGRFYADDLTSCIFSQTSDGLRIAYSMPAFSCSAYGGYTGLVNAKSYTVQGLSYDIKADQPYQLNAKYIAAGLKLQAPSLINNQTFGAEFSGFFNVDTTENTDGLSRAYGTLAADGPVVSKVYYSLSSSLGILYGGSGDPVFGNLSKASVTWYPGFLSSSVSASGVYATDKFMPFTFTGISINDAFSYSNVLKTGLALSIKPAEKISCTADGYVFFVSKADNSALAASAVQWTASGKWKITSDAFVSLTAGQIIPLADGVDPYLMGTTRAVISF
jgi:hypothetical protein